MYDQFVVLQPAKHEPTDEAEVKESGVYVRGKYLAGFYAVNKDDSRLQRGTFAAKAFVPCSSPHTSIHGLALNMACDFQLPQADGL